MLKVVDVIRLCNLAHSEQWLLFLIGGVRCDKIASAT